MFKLALQTEDEIIQIGDKVEVLSKTSTEPITGTLDQIFKSVWAPYSICIHLKEMEPHLSIDISGAKYIKKL